MLETRPLAEAAAALEAALRNEQRDGLGPMIGTLQSTLEPAIAAVASLDQGVPVLAR